MYADRTVIPTGGHEQVISSVGAFRGHGSLHRLGCVGLIDCDDNTEVELRDHWDRGVYVIGVSEVENLLLLPVVFYTLARSLKFSRGDAREKTDALRAMILEHAATNIVKFSAEYARRRIDRAIKSVGLKANEPAALQKELESAFASIKVEQIVLKARTALQERIASKDVYGVLRLYDNKGMLAEAAKFLGISKRSFEEYVGRHLADPTDTITLRVLRLMLPRLGGVA